MFSRHSSGTPYVVSGGQIGRGGNPVFLGRNRESRRREAVGRRNWPKAVPRKVHGRKRAAY